MTTGMMNPRDLVEMTPDADRLGEMIGLAAERLRLVDQAPQEDRVSRRSRRNCRGNGEYRSSRRRAGPLALHPDHGRQQPGPVATTAGRATMKDVVGRTRLPNPKAGGRAARPTTKEEQPRPGDDLGGLPNPPGNGPTDRGSLGNRAPAATRRPALSARLYGSGLPRAGNDRKPRPGWQDVRAKRDRGWRGGIHQKVVQG